MNTYSHSQTHTITNARHVAAKIGTDLKRVQRISCTGKPSDHMIQAYESEAIILLNEECLESISYGFKRNGIWVAALRYVACNGELRGGANSDPGGIIFPNNLNGATFYSFLELSAKWYDLSLAQQSEIESKLPFQRTVGDDPGANVSWSGSNRNYVSGDIGVSRYTTGL